MFLYKKIAIAVLAVLVGVPTVSMAGSITTSLIQGKTPSEAISILAEQIDLLTGRVASLEDKQTQLEADVSQNKSDTELEIERLKLENENLRLKTDEVLSGTAETRANEARKKQCSELAAQINAKEQVVRAPFEEQIEPLRAQVEPLENQMRELKISGTGIDVDIVADAETQILLNRLENGEDLGDFSQEERNKVREYQGRVTDAQIAAFNEIREQEKELQTQIDVLEKNINSIELEKEKALDALRAMVEFKTLQDKANALLCA